MDLPATADGGLIAGRYRLTETLGRGGMSTVYRGVDTALERPVAVKILSPLEADPAAVQRTQSEILVLASLSHRGLVTLFDASTAVIDGVEKTFLVMELVDGPSLGERLRDRPLTTGEATVLATDLAEALHVVHERGIVHRDIKPANILLGPPALTSRPFEAKLADFGIAALTARTSQLTATGTMVGTAAYLSPEQPRGLPATAASDVYSLGLVLLEALTGQAAFPGTMAETLAARMTRAPDVPATLGYRWRSLLGAMTALEPADRPTAVEVLDRLGHPDEPGATAVGLPSGAGAASAAAATAAAAAAVDPAATAALPEQVTPATRLLPTDDAATRVLSTDDQATRVFAAQPAAAAAAGSGAGAGAAAGGSGGSGGSGADGRRRRRIIAAGVVTAVAAAAVIVALSVFAANGPQEAAVTDPTTPASSAPSAEPSTEASTEPSDEPSAEVTEPEAEPVATQDDTPSTDPAPATDPGTGTAPGAGTDPGTGGSGTGPGTGAGPGNSGGPGTPADPGQGNGNGNGKGKEKGK